MNDKVKVAHKGSLIGEAYYNAAVAAGFSGDGLKFEYDGRTYRVVDPNHKGLRSYFSYEAVEPVKPARFRLLYAGPLADLISKPLKPRDSEATDAAGTIPPYLRDILAAMRPDPEHEVWGCPCGGHAGSRCSLPGCMFETASAEAPEAEECPCGCGATDPDFDEVPGAEEPRQRVEVVSVVRSVVDPRGPSVTIKVMGITPDFKPGSASDKEAAAAVVAAIAAHFGVAAPATDENAWSRLRAANVFLSQKVARLEAENKRLSGLYNNAEYQRGANADRAIKLEGIISKVYDAALQGYQDAEIIPF